MNYVGSISIIDRGDAPAKAVIDKNTRSLAQRVADETKEELDKVMDRVDNIYVSYEMATQTMFDNPRGSPNVEYVEDIKELEELLTDTVKKKKYHQQVTVFVVGFQDVCAQKMQLLQQVNQFFLENSKLDEEEVKEEKPEVDLEEASNKVNESLNTAEELAKRLGDLNQDIIEWLVNYANTKASNKAGGMVQYEKGKKRLEKSLEAAKNDVAELSEKLLKLQTELEEKEEKFQQMGKQLDAKTQEVVRYKTAAEVAKKSAQDNEAHTAVLQDEITRRDEKILELRTKLSRAEINLSESNFDKELSTRKLDKIQVQTKGLQMQAQERLSKLQEEVQTSKIAVTDAEREMEKLHHEQLINLQKTHAEEIDELKKEHQDEIIKLTDEVQELQDQLTLTEQDAHQANDLSEELKGKLLELQLEQQLREKTTENTDIPISRESSAKLSGKSIGEISMGDDDLPSSKQESRPSTKDTKSSKKSESLKPGKASKSPNRIGKDKGRKEYADASMQDEGGDSSKAFIEKSNEPSRQPTRQSKNLEPVMEGDEFPNTYELDDEDSWSNVPSQHIPGRFLQYRRLTMSKLKELEDQLQVTLTKTHRKVNSLKSQFNEHKTKWESERKILIEQVEQAQKLQTDAEKEADAAMTQLEEFINEQEKLEDEEEQKRQEIIKSMSRPGTVKQMTPAPTEPKPVTPDAKPVEQAEALPTDQSEQELTNLMQQTDDAKAQKNSRNAGVVSAPPTVEQTDLPTRKQPEISNIEEDNESSPLTVRNVTSASMSGRKVVPKEIDGPISPPKEAFRTPRSARNNEISDDVMSISTDPDEGVAMEVTRSQSEALNTMKSLMDEDNMTFEQQKTLDSLRSAIRTLSSEQKLRDIQLERTVTILSLASQIARESVELGILPDGVFDGFSKMDSRSMSALSGDDESSVFLSSGVSRKKSSLIKKLSAENIQSHLKAAETDTDLQFNLVKQPRSKTSKPRRSREKSAESLKKVDVPKESEFTTKNEHKVELMKEKTKLSKTTTKLEKELTMSSDFTGCSSDVAGSFSGSLPRTLTSSEWRKVSPHEPHSISTEMKQKVHEEPKEKKEPKTEIITEKVKKETKTEIIAEKQTTDVVSTGTQSDLTMEDIANIETKMSVVISPKKKTRSVTMEQMLYGESSSKPKDDTMTNDNKEAVEKPASRERTRTKLRPKSETEQQPSSPSGQDHSDNTNSSHAPSPKSSNSIGPQKLSAKSKHSVFDSEVSAHSALPNSPSTNGHMSPVTINRSPRTSATPGTMVSDIQRPVSISSVQPKFPETPPPYITYNPSKETQTDDWISQIEREPVKGSSEEEVRQSSAKSRASLRNQFKSRLDETRHAVEERRTKSPVIMVPAQKSIDDELIIDDDDDDLPIPDDQKEFFKEDTLDAGTSPPPGRRISLASRKSTKLGDHPVVQEYLRAYTGIHNFKEAMSRVLIDKEQMSASQILTDLDKLPFDKDGPVVSQVTNMTENIYYVLNEVSQVVNSVLQNDRGPVVSSLMMGMSRDATQRTINREKSGVTVDFHPDTRGSQRTVSKAGSMSIDAGQYQELQSQYEKLQNQMADDGKKYEDQQRHNVVVMMEMQDTINQLQRELSSLGKQNRQPTSGSASALGNQNPDSAIMFTRLDSERNAKIMKKAVNEKKLDTDKYKEAMVQMNDYVNLPAQRLAHLVKKYVHHCRMKEIEENVQKSQSLNENVFELFDKMEALQNQRAKRWANRMDEMGMERYRLANMLMETLDCIEQESGIFLIKPMYSYRGREQKDHQYGGGKITRPFRPHRTLSPLRDSSSAHAPAPTPASNMRTARHQARKDEPSQYPQDAGQVQYVPKGPLEGDSTGLLGATVNYVGAQPRATWNMADSQIGMHSPTMGNVNTPRILELDINRMMIGQNTISAPIGSPGLSNDRLVNAANNNLRSYMTVNRPGPNSAGKNDRPSSGSRNSPRPSSSPTNQSASTAKRVRLSDVDVPSVMTSSQPLPPIGLTDRPRSSSSKGRQSPPRIPVGNELPESPPGSSLRQSPVQDTDINSPIK